jgi:HlyD family secretion protein
MVGPAFIHKLPKPARIVLPLLVLGGVALLALRATGVLGARTNGPVRASGIIEARTIEVACEVTGVVVKRPVEKGQQVQRGQVLAEVADETSAAQLSQAKAAEDTARQKLQQAEAAVALQESVSGSDVSKARAAVNTAAARAADTDAGARPQEIAAAQASVRQALAAMAASQAQLKQLEAGLRPEEIRQAQAAYEGATADVAAARAKLADLERGSRAQEIEAARAAVDKAQTALTKATKDLDRVRSLVAQGAMSDQQLDASVSAHDAAAADLKSAQERLALLKEGPTAEALEAARETVNRALANQRSAQEALSLARKGPRQEEIARARAAVSQSRATYEAAQAQLSLIASGARSGQRRMAHSQTDEARAALRLAESNLKAVEVKRRDAQAARAALAQAQAATRQADIALAKFRVVAPVDGLVDDTHVREGEMLRPGASVVTLVDFSDTWVTVYVPEPLLPRVAVGQTARVTVDGVPGRGFEGKVRRISSQAEFTPKYVQTQDERARTVFAVEIAVPNAEGLLKPGMPADAVFEAPGTTAR